MNQLVRLLFRGSDDNPFFRTGLGMATGPGSVNRRLSATTTEGYPSRFWRVRSVSDRRTVNFRSLELQARQKPQASFRQRFNLPRA